MDKIKLHDKTFRLSIRYAEIEKAIDEVAEKINLAYRDVPGPKALICVLNGAILFTAELMKRLDFDIELISLKLSSYVGTQSTGEVAETLAISGDVCGKHVLIVEDIIDSGRTIEVLYNMMVERGASDVRICTMLLKPGCYVKPIPLDFVGLNIPDDFIVGFGLDYDELGRNYKDIYILDE